MEPNTYWLAGIVSWKVHGFVYVKFFLVSPLELFLFLGINNISLYLVKSIFSSRSYNSFVISCFFLGCFICVCVFRVVSGSRVYLFSEEYFFLSKVFKTLIQFEIICTCLHLVRPKEGLCNCMELKFPSLFQYLLWMYTFYYTISIRVFRTDCLSVILLTRATQKKEELWGSGETFWTKIIGLKVISTCYSKTRNFSF